MGDREFCGVIGSGRERGEVRPAVEPWWLIEEWNAIDALWEGDEVAGALVILSIVSRRLGSKVASRIGRFLMWLSRFFLFFLALFLSSSGIFRLGLNSNEESEPEAEEMGMCIRTEFPESAAEVEPELKLCLEL